MSKQASRTIKDDVRSSLWLREPYGTYGWQSYPAGRVTISSHNSLTVFRWVMKSMVFCGYVLKRR